MKGLLLTLPLFWCGSLFAQNNDYSSWFELEMKKKIMKKVRGELEFQHRGKDDFTSRSRFLFSPKVNVKLPGPFEAKAIWRNTYKSDRQYATNRLALSLYYKYKKIKRADLTNRTSYQYEFDHLGDQEGKLRNKLTFTYDIKKWRFDPIIAVEGFYRFHYKREGFEAVRLNLGFTHAVGKKKRKQKKKDGEKPVFKKTRLKLFVKREWNVLDARKSDSYIVHFGYSVVL